VAPKAKKPADKLGKPFKEMINAALRTGLDPSPEVAVGQGRSQRNTMTISEMGA